jgi:CDP-paratose 2-epimerase
MRAAPILVTGGAGFIGSTLADQLAASGESVRVLDSLARPGVAGNLDWLCARHRNIECVIADMRDAEAVADAARDVRAVFHLAAQVAVTTSMDDPVADLQVNLLGTVNLLEALRRRRVPLIFASTNKVYGGLGDIVLVDDEEAYRPSDSRLARYGIDETRPLQFCTPYGCSKGGADQYVLDYAKSFGVPTAVLRMSCIYGPRQLGTEDQGWVAHFALKAIAGEPIMIYGDGRQVRDILHVEDAVAAYIAAWRRIGRIAGQAFNLGGGPDNAVSLLRLVRQIESMLGHATDVRFAPWRPNDQRWFVADARRAAEIDGLIAQGVGYIYFVDEIFLPQRPLLEALRSRQVRFGVQTRIDLWKPELLDLLGAAGCVSVEAGVESLTPEGREALDKKCRLSTEELTSLLIRARRTIPFVQANLIKSASDDASTIAEWRIGLQRHGVWANDPVPLFPYPSSPDYYRLWGVPDDQAWERAHAHYLAQFDRFSEIQEAHPLPLAELEACR